MSQRTVAVNERGARIGQDHPKAVLTNTQVELLLQMRAEGMSYRQLALVWEISKESVADYCKGRRRMQIATAHRVVCVP